MSSDLQSAFRPAAVVPCYNHPKTVGKVAAALRRLGLSVLLVNDGSNAETRAVLDALAQADSGIMVIHRPENGGKGAACLSGFRAAAKRGFTHVLQVDADAQHDLSEIPNFLRVALNDPKSLVCGWIDCPDADHFTARLQLLQRTTTA